MYLYGASGYSRVIIDILMTNQLNLEGLFDDYIRRDSIDGFPIFSTDLIPKSKIELFISIGDNKTRKRISKEIDAYYITLCHPSAIISNSVVVGDGTSIIHNAILQAGCIIGRHVIVNTAASIDHECVLADYVHVSPNSTLCGNVSVGEGTWIGAGSVILPGVTIGKWCTIGAGSVVDKDIPDFCLAVGNRCKIIKRYE